MTTGFAVDVINPAGPQPAQLFARIGNGILFYPAAASTGLLASLGDGVDHDGWRHSGGDLQLDRQVTQG